MALADAKAIDAGITAAHDAREAMAKVPPYQRRDVLMHCVRRFQERADELAMALCIEAGKPIRDARGEVTRLVDTFREGAEESTRLHGEVLNLEISARARGYRGMTKRVPIGPCSFISPFNFPLNLAAHKVAPAIAAGCTWVLKPASRTPVGALIIGEVLAETDLPRGAFSILPAHRGGADLFTTDPRLKLLSFTGSPAVGWDLKAQGRPEEGGAGAGRQRGLRGRRGSTRAGWTTWSRGWSSAPSTSRARAASACSASSRTSRSTTTLKARLIAATRALVAGDPKREDTFIGPMISEAEAARLEGWIQSAVSAGGKLLCGGQRNGAHAGGHRAGRRAASTSRSSPRRPSARSCSSRR